VALSTYLRLCVCAPNPPPATSTAGSHIRPAAPPPRHRPCASSPPSLWS